MASEGDIDTSADALSKGGYTRAPYGRDFWRPSDRALACPAPRKFRDHWLGLSNGGPMPRREALDPIDIPALLPHIVLVDVFRDPLRLKYRLIGTFVTTLAERDATNRFIDRDLYGEALEAMMWPYQQVLEQGRPAATLSPVLFAERDWHNVENVFLPFGADGVIELIAVCVDVNRTEGQRQMTHGLILDWAG
jgi:hypothetical protein